MNAWGATAATLAVAALLGASIVPLSPHAPASVGPGDVTLWSGLTALPAAGTLLVQSPAAPYPDQEVAAIARFLEGGGRLVVVEATPEAASLVHALGYGIEASTALVFDPDVDGEGRFTVTGTGALGVDGQEPLRRAQVALGGTPVLATSQFAWQDQDRDGVPGLEEPRGAWSVVAVQPAGAGDVLVVGSAQLLREGEAAQRLGEWVAERGPLIRDVGHQARPSDPAGATGLLAGHRTVGVAVALAAAAAAAVAVAWRVRLRRVGARRRRGPVDRETLEILAELGP